MKKDRINFAMLYSVKSNLNHFSRKIVQQNDMLKLVHLFDAH